MNPLVRTLEDDSGDLRRYLNEYNYQPTLTAKLDAMKTPLCQETSNEIALWKVNRYVALEPDVLRALNAAADLKRGQHRTVEGLLKQLLEAHGVDLAMA